MKISSEDKIFYRSYDAANVYAACPNICVLPSGRMIVVHCIFGPGIEALDCEKCVASNIHAIERILISDDGGESWRHVGNAPMMHARVFAAGNSVYIMGHEYDVMIMRSDDDGETWTAPSKLTEGQSWCHEAPCNVHYENGCVYLVMERKLDLECRGLPSSIFAPVLMRGKCDSDLTKRESWTFASEMCCRETVDIEKCNYFGMPFYKSNKTEPNVLCMLPRKRSFYPPGWSESNVVKFTDPNHVWYDPSGKTFHLIMSAHTGRSNLAAILKVVENEDGTLTTMTEKAPSGEPIIYLPFPGGSMKFYILWDEKSSLFWMVGMQATDSASRPETISTDRMSLPCNETHRVVLHFSKNCIDWCFAGLVDKGETERHSRYSPSMAICGDDLLILCRSADDGANYAHDSNLITMHRVKNFRDLVY